MKKINYLLCFSVFTLFIQSKSFGQTLLNGSFETTTGNCDYNLSNSVFNSMMSDCHAFGNNSQIDIINSACPWGAAQQGNYFIGVAVDITNTLTDALSLKLSSPLIVGSTYTVRFYNKKDAAYNTNLLEVGYSIDSISFGHIIDTTALPTTSWELVSFTFKPVESAQFLTVRTIAGTYSWSFVDNFSISVVNPVNNTPIQDRAVQLFPNPTSSSISILTDESNKIITTTIRDMQGQSVLVTDQNNIDLSGLNAGVFIVEVNTEKGRVIKRVVRQ